MVKRSGNKSSKIRKDLVLEYYKNPGKMPSREDIKNLEEKYKNEPGCKNLWYHFNLLNRYFLKNSWGLY